MAKNRKIFYLESTLLRRTFYGLMCDFQISRNFSQTVRESKHWNKVKGYRCENFIKFLGMKFVLK